MNKPLSKLTKGFTLIEVLLALAIIAIALTALLKASSEDISMTERIKNKTINHWIAMQGIAAIQMGLIKPNTNQDTTEVTTLFGQKWYWRATISSTPIKQVQQIKITVSHQQSGPYSDPLIGFRLLL